MDVAKTDEIKALLRKAEETRDCPSSGFLSTRDLVSGLESCLLSPLRYASTSHVSTVIRGAVVDILCLCLCNACSRDQCL